MTRVIHSRVAADATAQGALGNDYGLTLPVRILFQVQVKKDGNEWAPVVTSLTGEYCVQARILPHQTDVTEANIPNIVTQNNFQAVLDALDQLGEPGGGHNFYSRAAVQAHEDAHANRCRLALENKKAEIIAPIEVLRVPINPGANMAQGLAAIQALPEYTATVGGAYAGPSWQLWFDELLALVAEDHNGAAWCHAAERRINNMLTARINARVESQRWRAVPGQLALPAHLGVQQAHAQIQAVAPVVPAPVVIPDGALGVARAQAQLQARDPSPPRVARPIDLPDGALGVAGAQARFLQANNDDARQPVLTNTPKKNLPVWPPVPTL